MDGTTDYKLNANTAVHSTTPVLEKEHQINRYVELLTQKVPNWQQHVKPFFEVYEDLQAPVSTQRVEQHRRGALAVDSESDRDGESVTDDGQRRGGARGRAHRDERHESPKEEGSDASRGGHTGRPGDCKGH
jgi:hypothetical protein